MPSVLPQNAGARGSHGERKSTTVSLAWLRERLATGHYKRVSQAVGKVKREPDRRQQRRQKQLVKVGVGPELPKH